ncbi:DUF4328 domain-containing protein [Streptomyces cynarae]|uniref:DUF4328 domain-containing protein n=1 Tax=Streptomyces cynarae TaxID=2981134 RepID=A0ABY6E8W1_9ACTN|nr:DUF4328 domain-containing protein [Streptomyces cynarae]UXY23010.1 DUF4328 domain-containing protein [Streptomyces cynarae]
MTTPDAKSPRLYAGFAQCAIAVAAVADVYRATAVRAHVVHATDASLKESGFASMVFVYAMTAAAVLFLVWLARCRRNAQILTGATVGASGVWSVVAWFIPVLNWWFPRRFVLDVERASAGVSQKASKATLVNAWWAVWVAHLVTGAVAFAVGQASAIAFVVVAETLTIGAAVLAICVIEHLTRLQGAAPGAVAHVEPLAQA